MHSSGHRECMCMGWGGEGRFWFDSFHYQVWKNQKITKPENPFQGWDLGWPSSQPRISQSCVGWSSIRLGTAGRGLYSRLLGLVCNCFSLHLARSSLWGACNVRNRYIRIMTLNSHTVQWIQKGELHRVETSQVKAVWHLFGILYSLTWH